MSSKQAVTVHGGPSCGGASRIPKLSFQDKPQFSRMIGLVCKTVGSTGSVPMTARPRSCPECQRRPPHWCRAFLERLSERRLERTPAGARTCPRTASDSRRAGTTCAEVPAAAFGTKRPPVSNPATPTREDAVHGSTRRRQRERGSCTGSRCTTGICRVVCERQALTVEPCHLDSNR